MKKHHIHKRITALLLLVSMLVGLLPAVYSLPAQAATAADLIAQIDSLEELIPTNKRVPTIEYSTINTTNQGKAWTAYTNLGGKTYIIVNTLKEYTETAYYYPEGYFAAMNPIATSASGEIAATRVQPVALSAAAGGGYALLGADPAWGLKMTVNPSGNDIVNPSNGTSATLRMNCSLYHAGKGKYLTFDYTTGAITFSSSADANMVIYGNYNANGPSPGCDFRDANGSNLYRMYLEGYKDPDHPVYKLASPNLTTKTPGRRALIDLYEVLTNRANTEPIYNAIVRGGQALKAGIGKDNAAFLAALETAIACYNNYNGEDVTGTAKTNAETELAAALAALTPYVDHTEDIEALPLPQNVLVTGENNIDNLEGAAYYILTKEADGKTGHLLNINLEPTDGYAHAEDVEVYSYSVSEEKFVTSNTYVADADPSMAIKVMEAENVTGLSWTSTFRSVRGSTISYAAKSGYTDGTQVFTAGNRTMKLHSYDVSAGQQRLMVYGSGAAYRSYIRYNASVDGFEYVLSQVTSDNSTYSKAPTGIEWYFYFYKMAVQVAELYRAIDRMKVYADGNADGQYDPEVYGEFIQCLEEAIEKYQLHCYLSADSVLEDEDDETITVTEELNKLADDLLAYRALLTAADMQAEYIDVPVEILDFRADGMLFEYYNSEFGLVSSNGTDDANMGGKFDNAMGTRTGQTLQTLTENRELIYTKETVNYVAHTLNDNKNQTDEAELNHFVNLAARAPGSNDNLWTMLREKDMRLGSWEDTLKDTDTGENGGVLPLANIDSCFDMAYYILNGLWRKVDQENDILADGVPYNLPVPERDRVRLYLDEETGLYKLESNKDVVTYDYYAANAIPPVENIDPYAGPFFQPINNLGFEEPTLMESLGGDTDTSKHHYKNRTFNCEEMNFHYTLHAYGSFIYYRDRNLRFEFVGDDDVYFFINNKMAMDIGGGHQALGSTLYLNDKAEELGLVDGGIYTFDMFYAERHTTASNLNFNTNIIIVDTETITTMGQYLVESANVSQVDSTTGLGTELNENALVNVGDTVAYSFDLLNVRDVPIYNISFVDKNLGTNISPDGITLYSSDKTNGAKTKITDISVYYRTYADDTVDSSVPKVMTYADMEKMLEEACEEPVNDVFSSLAPGSYVVRIETVDQLQTLLKIGLPIDCQMSVYGVKRTTVEGDTPFSNTVTSLAHYKRVGDFTEEAEEFSVSGVATRSLQVAGAVPEATPQRFVLDYGKPLAIDLDAIRKSIRTDRSVTVTSFAGLSTTGQNSQLLVYKPNLSCTKETEPYTTENGTYTLSGNQLVFQMSDFMDSTDRVYAAFELNGCVVISGGVRTEYRYIFVELVLVPATSVYYEAEDFTHVIDTEIADLTAGTEVEQWTTVGEDSTHPYQDMDVSAVVADAPANTLLEDINADGYGALYPLSSANVQNAVAKLGTAQPFSITHRGAWRRTSANSLLAVYDSIMYGMDAAEIDIQLTSDNIPVLCHDANIRNATTATAQTTVASLTYAQLKDYPLVSGSENNYHNTTYSLTAADVEILKGLSHYTGNYGTPAEGDPLYMPSLASVCDLLKTYGPNTMLTLDKMDVQNNFAYSYKIVREKGLLNNVIFKFGAGSAAKNTTNLDAWLNAAATAAGVTASEVKSTAMLMYVSGYGINTATLNDYLTKGYRFVAVEYTYDTSNMPDVETKLIDTVAPFCKSKGLMLSGSTISGTSYRHYCGGRPEEETTWALLYNMGCTAIMTDMPQELGAFLETYDAERNVIRQSSDPIQAEAFSEYNCDAENLRCNQALDSNGNKVVLGMSKEDYLAYNNISFTGTEDTLYFRGQGLHRSAVLRFYIDSTDPDNCIASQVLPVTGDCVSMTAKLLQEIPAGIHAVYVMAYGTDGVELANFDSFSFAPEDHYLLFDFDNSQESQARYELGIYGGLDFDNVESWYTNDTKLTISDGAITLTDSPTSEKSYSYFVTGVGDQDDNPLRYTAGINDYCQIRFRIDNGAAAADGTPKLILCFGIDGSKVIGNDEVPGTSLTLDLGEVGDKGYVTKTFPLADNFTGNITSICAFFKNVVSGDTQMTISIDYLYIGPIEQEDSLYFTFDNTEADQLRYEGAAYGGGKFNFDAPSDHVAGAWATTGNTANASGTKTFNDFTVDNTEGTATIYVQNGLGGESVYGPKFMTTATPGYYPYGADNGKRAPLSYDASGAEYAQVRFRIDGCESVDASGNATAPVLQMEFRFNDTSGGSSILYDAFKTNYTLSDGKWMTVTLPLTGAFTAAEAVTTIGVRFLNIRSKSAETRGTIKIDYIFVGPKEDLPTNQNLLFDFTNTAADRQRYSSTTYGYYNFDLEGKGYWATHGTAQLDDTTQKGYVQRYNMIAVDNTAGVAEVAVTFSKGDESAYGPKVMTTGIYNEYPWTGRATLAPLSYYPENAEFMQVRFKLEGCTTDSTDTIPWVQMEYHYHDPSTNLDNIKYGDNGTTKQTYTILEGEWITVTLPLSATFRNAMKITSLGLRFRGLKAKSESVDGVLTIDYIYVGTREDLPSAYAPVYGYDSGYDGDETLSDNGSLYVEGKGIKLNASTKKYTQASFSFVGTGFDLISRTGADQATIRVSIYTDAARTKLYKAITVQNKGEMELYQIPVVSVRELSYGTYYVTVGVNAAITNSAYPMLNRGGQFYFDALRIYEPLDLSEEANGEALELYREHKEAYPYVQEVRNILLTATAFEAVAGTTSGAVFIDAGQDNNGSYTTPEVKTYESLGPKNETYLAQNQAVAFKLVLNTAEIPMSIDIGAKSITGGSPTLLVGYGGKKGSGSTPAAVAQSMTTLTQALKTSTGMYYPLSVQADHFTTGSDGLKYMYIVLCNQGADVLSVTDIKVAYERVPTYLTATAEESTAALEIPSEKRSYAVATAGEVFPISCMVDGETFEVAKCFLAEGELPPAESVDETVAIYHTLNLASDIAVSFLVPEAQLSAYDSFYMECTVPLYNGTQQEGSRVETLYPTLKSGYYYFTLTGLTAVNMADTIEAVVHMTADGTAFVSEKDTYSIATYAYAQLDKASTGDSLKALCAQLLRYGAAAQIYKGYRTDALADAGMTDTHRAYLTELDTVSFGNTNCVLEDLSEASATWLGKTLNLESRVAVKYVFSVADYTGDPEELSLHISYTDLDGEQITATVENPEPYGSDGKRYTFSYDGLPAAELRTVLSAQIYRGETPVSPTLQYSPDTYGKGKTGTLGDLCKALFAYSDSAKTYFLY